MSKNEMEMSLRSELLASTVDKWDKIANTAVKDMMEKDTEECIITLKTVVSIEKVSVNNCGNIVEVEKPVFKSTVSSVMQVKNSGSVTSDEDVALVYDDELGKFVYRKIENGQMSFDDYGEDGVIDAEYQELPAHEDELSDAAESDEDSEEGNYPTDSEEENPDVVASTEDASSDGEALTPYGWLKQFVGSELKVTEAMGNYTVRSEDNKVVLSSATDPSNVFYCDADKLSGHVDHVLKCELGFGSDTEDSNRCIKIICVDCDEEIFRMYSDAADDDEGGSYNYEEPEE